MASGAWRAWVIGVVAVASLVSVGCGRRGIIRDARMQRYTQNMVRLAARDTGCHESQLVPTQIASEPAVFTVTGCQVPVEYWLQCGRRGRRCSWRNVPTLNESAAPVLACAPQMIQLQPTQAPGVRFASGCGRIAPFAVACNGAACGWSQSGPVQMGGGAPPPQQQLLPQQPPPPATAVVVPGPQQQPAPPPSALQSQVQSQREAILSCIDTGSLTLRMRWTADGQVLVQLPAELVGTAAEGCIQAVLGGMRVAAQAAGEVVVPVQ